MPDRFLNACLGDRREATRRYLATVKWRKDDHIDGMLDSASPRNFEVIKKYYPHYYCGRGRSGNVVYYEDCGKIDVPALASSGVGVSDIVHHYVYITEFCFAKLKTDEDARTISVFDVDGVGVGDLKGPVMDFIKATTKIMQDHYPERSQCILVINAPSWFTIIWSMVKVFIDARTQAKVKICSRADAYRTILKVVEHDQIPEKYGGGLRVENGRGGENNCRLWSPDEVLLREWARDHGGGEQ